MGMISCKILDVEAAGDSAPADEALTADEVAVEAALAPDFEAAGDSAPADEALTADVVAVEAALAADVEAAGDSALADEALTADEVEAALAGAADGGLVFRFPQKELILLLDTSDFLTNPCRASSYV
jgi:hypothetical protein